MNARKVAILVCLVIVGCGEAGRGVVLWGPQVGDAPREDGSANLALGPSGEHVWLAMGMSYRSSWPSTEAGYRFEDASESVTIEHDTQFYYNRFGGYYRTGATLRRAVLLR